MFVIENQINQNMEIGKGRLDISLVVINYQWKKEELCVIM